MGKYRRATRTQARRAHAPRHQGGAYATRTLVVVIALKELIRRRRFSAAAAEHRRRQPTRSTAPSRTSCIAGAGLRTTEPRGAHTELSFATPARARQLAPLAQRPSLWPTHWTALSEIHLSAARAPAAAADDGLFITTLRPYALDDDGDLVLPRRGASPPPSQATPADPSDAIRILHACETSMEAVGLQLWAGALVLSEFVLANKHLFDGATVLELGAGLALPSLCAASAGARRVYATDYADEVLANCAKNLALNAAFLRGAPAPVVRRLDWLSSSLPTANDAAAADGPWEWQPADREALSRDIVMLAADVVYDETLTNGMRMCPPAIDLRCSADRSVG